MKSCQMILRVEMPADLADRMEIEAKVLGVSIGELVVMMIATGFKAAEARNGKWVK